jgi:DNA repair ATPase RecN
MDVEQELEGLRQRSEQLVSDISVRQTELQRLQQLAAPRLATWVQSQVRELEGRAASLRVELERAEETWEKQGTGAQVEDSGDVACLHDLILILLEWG